MSGVILATMIRSICAAITPAISIARRAALAARSEVNSFAAAMRRSLMPVRVVIHSSEVSTIFSRSALVRIFSGTYEPTPVMEQERTWRSCGGRDFFDLAVIWWVGRELGRGVALHLRGRVRGRW